MHQALVDSVKAAMVLIPQVKNGGAASSKFVDMQGWDSVDFLVAIGATDTTVDAKLQVSDNADGSSPTDIAGAAITQVSGTGDNRMAVISVKRDSIAGRYVGCVVTAGSGTSGAAIAVTAVRYAPNATTLPVTQEAATANSYATAEVVRV